MIILLYCQNEFKIYVNKEFFVWQHSYLVNEKEVLFKSQIDGAHRNEKYSKYFNIELKYTKYEIINPIQQNLTKFDKQNHFRFNYVI